MAPHLNPGRASFFKAGGSQGPAYLQLLRLSRENPVYVVQNGRDLFIWAVKLLAGRER